MKGTLASKLISFEATLSVADQPDNQPIWQNQPPLAFTAGLTAARTAVVALGTAGASQSVPTTGTTDALRDIRKKFEAALLPLTRATFRCLTKLGRTADAVTVDFSPTDLHNARATILAGMGETVLELAEPLSQPPAVGQPAPGTDYGITPAAVAAVDDLWQRYSTAVGAPGGKRAARKADTTALPGKFAAVEAQFAELDDLILQFNTTAAGQRFIDAWFNARRVQDTGRRAAKPNPQPSPTPPAQS